MTRAIEIGGRLETLAFTVNHVCLLEEITGKPLSAVLSLDLSGLRALMWCGLLNAHPEWTLKQAGEALDDYLRAGGDLEALCGQLTDALEDAGFFRTAKRE